MKNSNELVRFDDVTLGYGRRVVLTGLSFHVVRGEFLGIVGANGSGKTTILRCLLGMRQPRQGRVTWGVAPAQRRCGYVPQRHAIDELFPLSAHAVAMMGRGAVRPPWARCTSRDREIVRAALHRVGMEQETGTMYRDLSGGQKQRVLIARALAADAAVLVLDEPTDGMDLKAQRTIYDLVERLQRDRHLTVIYVTHRLNELANSAHRLLLLHAGQFRVGTADQILNADTLGEVYDVDVEVRQMNGRRMIIT